VITHEYKEQCRLLHEKQSWGNHGWKALPQVLSMILQFRRRNPSVLDFGAGERTLENTAKWAMPHLKVTSYDPGMPGIDKLPEGNWDFTVCTDVLEHIEPEFLEKTLDLIYERTECAAYFIIATSKAKAILPDGRNAHLIIRPHEWWTSQLMSRWKKLDALPGKGCVLMAHDD
jgi:Methyltransferase domain